MIIRASLAFIFSADLSQVLLIRKTKPPKHAGLLNGLGGKCEEDESDLDCVIREVTEEAGITLPPDRWRSMGQLAWESWRVTMWTAVLMESLPQTFPEDGVAWYPTSPVPENVLTNLRWLIPLAVDIHEQNSQGNTAPRVIAQYE